MSAGRAGRAPRRSFRAWIVTGGPARAVAFALDFAAAVYKGVTGKAKR